MAQLWGGTLELPQRPDDPAPNSFRPTQGVPKRKETQGPDHPPLGSTIAQVSLLFSGMPTKAGPRPGLGQMGSIYSLDKHLRSISYSPGPVLSRTNAVPDFHPSSHPLRKFSPTSSYVPSTSFRLLALSSRAEPGWDTPQQDLWDKVSEGPSRAILRLPSGCPGLSSSPFPHSWV